MEEGDPPPGCIMSIAQGPYSKVHSWTIPVGMQGLSLNWTRKWLREVMWKEREVVEVLTGMDVEDTR
jgi:hypothetical protein